jgi:hypothetical protein
VQFADPLVDGEGGAVLAPPEVKKPFLQRMKDNLKWYFGRKVMRERLLKVVVMDVAISLII